MRRPPAHAHRIAAVILLLHAQSGIGSTSAPPPVFDPGRPGWTELDFGASKFLMSGTARIETRMRPSREITADLVTTPSGTPVAPGDTVLEMIYTASGLGRSSVTTLWADPVSGGTLQRTQLDGGSRKRQRTYRFTDVGAYHYTRWPAMSREESLGPEQWTERAEGMRPYSPGAEGKPVTEATVLIWMVAAADLSKTGDRLEAFTFSRKRVSRVIAEVIGSRAVSVDFTERDAAGNHHRRGEIKAIRLRVHGSPLTAETGDEEDEFELLGLRGDLDIALDPKTRAPLELRGRVKVVGQVTVRLRRVVLR